MEGILDRMVADFQAAALPTALAVLDYIPGLLSLLFAVQAAWDLMMWALFNKDLVTLALRRLLIFGLLMFLATSFPFWLPAITRTFTVLGEHVAQTGLSPSAILEQGLWLAMALYDSWAEWMTVLFPGINLFRNLAFWIVLAAFGLIAIQVTRTLIETALSLSGLAIFLAFLGHRHTFGLAEGYLRWVVENGCRLYVLYLLLAVGRNYGNAWTEELSLLEALDPVSNFSILNGSAAFAYIVWTLPDKIAQKIGGNLSFSGLNPLADRS